MRLTFPGSGRSRRRRGWTPCAMKPTSLDQVLHLLDRKTVVQLLRYVDQRQARDGVLRQLLMNRLGFLTSAPVVTVDQDELLTMPHVARLLKVSVGRAYELHRSGELPSVTLGERQVRVRRRDLIEYLQKRRTLAGVAQHQ
jgi:excisionase family DNA binding protein